MTTSTTALELDYIAAAAQTAVCPALIELMSKLLAAGEQHLAEGNNETALSCAKRANEILVLGWIEGERAEINKIKGKIYRLKTEAYLSHAAAPDTENRSGWEYEGFISAANGISFLGHAVEENWEVLAHLYYRRGQYELRHGNFEQAAASLDEANKLLKQYAPEHNLMEEIQRLILVLA